MKEITKQNKTVPKSVVINNGDPYDVNNIKRTDKRRSTISSFFNKSKRSINKNQLLNIDISPLSKKENNIKNDIDLLPSILIIPKCAILLCSTYRQYMFNNLIKNYNGREFNIKPIVDPI